MKKVERVVFQFTLWLLLLPQFAIAQASTPVDDLPIPHSARAVLDSFGKPLHPILGGVAPGGGVGVGIGYNTPSDRAWFHDAATMVTVAGYWSVQAETGYQTNKVHLGLFGDVRHMKSLSFYGIGPGSAIANESHFRLRESALGVRGWLKTGAGIRVGGSALVYSPDLGPGPPRQPAINGVFTSAEVPGLNGEPAFDRYRGFVEWASLTSAGPTFPDGQHGLYQIAAEADRDHDGGFYNFQRVEMEALQYFAGFRPGQRLSLHGLVALTNAGADVPYYLQYTLGGNGLNAFRPDMVGTDGTHATLRGYRNYRFRDRNLFLTQAEYRVPIRGPVHATVFYDLGQVAPHAGDLLKDLKQDTGFSVAYMNKGASLIRLDVGYGGGEGIHFFWGFGGFGF